MISIRSGVLVAVNLPPGSGSGSATPLSGLLGSGLLGLTDATSNVASDVAGDGAVWDCADAAAAASRAARANARHDGKRRVTKRQNTDRDWQQRQRSSAIRRVEMPGSSSSGITDRALDTDEVSKQCGISPVAASSRASAREQRTQPRGENAPLTHDAAPPWGSHAMRVAPARTDATKVTARTAAATIGNARRSMRPSPPGPPPSGKTAPSS